MKLPDKFMQEINRIANEYLNQKTKGTSTYYIAGRIENKRVCYTQAKTGYKKRWGFWSWIQTEYKNGKIKRTKFAKSGSRKKAQERAYRLLEQLKNN